MLDVVDELWLEDASDDVDEEPSEPQPATPRPMQVARAMPRTSAHLRLTPRGSDPCAGEAVGEEAVGEWVTVDMGLLEWCVQGLPSWVSRMGFPWEPLVNWAKSGPLPGRGECVRSGPREAGFLG
ncbi:hypothetical protein SSP24_50380 [Streptomyces spinoverrucosus]|uniref:Uncharacterized protein n=1 Tax=Streptomyces spinoverrucosus TaxID=284043 RepID=A0A4Y3VLF3_9ACTN|nr:hypothetical protein SSP24_50380 [Streptomyces spinoverrucosus]GHB54970.1 hypothetical protein GCM10010397_26670 [Streptomyces spinoverrucosus]